MIKYFFYLILFVLFNFSVRAQDSKKVDAKPINLIFENSIVMDSAGVKSFAIWDAFKEQQKTKIHIEFKNDTIWRYTTQNDTIIGDIFSLSKNNGILNFHPKKEKNKVYSSFDLFSKSEKYIVEKDIKNKKNILNYDCYYVKLTKIENDTGEFSSGNTIYEMYVTEKINLPVHAVINLTKNFNDFFPLEIKISEENIKGIYELYRLLEIK